MWCGGDGHGSSETKTALKGIARSGNCEQTVCAAWAGVGGRNRAWEAYVYSTATVCSGPAQSRAREAPAPEVGCGLSSVHLMM